MALLVRGKTRCSICGEVIGTRDECVLLPPIAPSGRDRLHVFHDAAVHATCFAAHPLADQVERRVNEPLERTAPCNRTCLVCGREVQCADEYFTLGFIEEPGESVLGRFNYATFHRSHLACWPRLVEVYRALSSAVTRGELDGSVFAERIAILAEALKEHCRGINDPDQSCDESSG